MKHTILFLTGMSGSGKGYFWEHYLRPTKKFSKLVSVATRPPREGEVDGIDYYFRDEAFFDDPSVEFATRLVVDQGIWKPGDPRHMYGVTKDEMQRNYGLNMVYDVIEPKYIRQMIDWCVAHKLNYDFKIAYFISPNNDLSIASARKNMPNDEQIRRRNTCDPVDFLRANLHPDYFMLSGPNETIFDARCMDFIDKVR